MFENYESKHLEIGETADESDELIKTTLSPREERIFWLEDEIKGRHGSHVEDVPVTTQAELDEALITYRNGAAARIICRGHGELWVGANACVHAEEEVEVRLLTPLASCFASESATVRTKAGTVFLKDHCKGFVGGTGRAVARSDSELWLYDSATGEAHEGTTTHASGQAFVLAWGSKVIASDQTTIRAQGECEITVEPGTFSDGSDVLVIVEGAAEITIEDKEPRVVKRPLYFYDV